MRNARTTDRATAAIAGIAAMAAIAGAASGAWAADDLSGDWEIRAMGADTKVQIQQKKDRVLVHRELWPEFEGERYKLEHLYRGKLTGTSLSGQLLVREEGQKKFEVLRSFEGAVE